MTVSVNCTTFSVFCHHWMLQGAHSESFSLAVIIGMNVGSMEIFQGTTAKGRKMVMAHHKVRKTVFLLYLGDFVKV